MNRAKHSVFPKLPVQPYLIPLKAQGASGRPTFSTRPLITRLLMQEVEERFALQKDKARRALTIGVFQQAKRFVFVLRASRLQRQPIRGEVLAPGAGLLLVESPLGNGFVATVFEGLLDGGDRLLCLPAGGRPVPAASALKCRRRSDPKYWWIYWKDFKDQTGWHRDNGRRPSSLDPNVIRQWQLGEQSCRRRLHRPHAVRAPVGSRMLSRSGWNQ